MARIKKAQGGSWLAKYVGREVAENLDKSLAKSAAKTEMTRASAKMAERKLPAEVSIRRAKAAAEKSSYRPTSLSERLSGARDDFNRTTRQKASSPSNSKTGVIRQDYEGKPRFSQYKSGGKMTKVKKAQSGAQVSIPKKLASKGPDKKISKAFESGMKKYNDSSVLKSTKTYKSGGKVTSKKK